jgi:hypothetical protein
VLTLYHDKNLCRQLGENGRRVTLEGNVNWEHDQKALVALYVNLMFKASDRAGTA